MENKIIFYKDDEGKLSVNVRFADEDVWLTQAQLADIYNTTHRRRTGRKCNSQEILVSSSRGQTTSAKGD